MKIVIVISILANCYFFQNSLGCDNTCYDQSGTLICLSLQSKCSIAYVKLFFCRKTCGACSGPPCTDSKTGKSSKCEINCSDKQNALTCQAIRIRSACRSPYAEEYCRSTCGICKECPTPPPACTNDCKDKSYSCSEWNKKGYCKTSSEFYPFMKINCSLTCGICKQCPTPPPKNTALPPTPSTRRACLPKGCIDTKNSCKYWKENGYCNKTEKYSYLLEVCQKSCNVCTPCPKLLPSPPSTEPPCSADCKEDNKNCEFWKSKGYCNSTSEHYDFMKENCPITCEFCKPCAVGDGLFTLEDIEKL